MTMVRIPATVTPAPAAPDSRRWMGAVLAVCVGATLLGVAWQRYQGGLEKDDGGPVRWQQRLNFEDRANGDIGVVDASGQEIARFAGEQGFLRIALRTLARERLRQGQGPQQPFELVAHANGRLSLRDPSTGMRIPLESFGPTQVSTFARLGPSTLTNDQGKLP